MGAQHGCTHPGITFEVLDRFRRSWARFEEKRIVFTFVSVPYFSAWGHGPGQGRNIYIYIYISHKPLKGRGVPPSCVRWPLVSTFVLKCIKVAN